MQCAKHGIAAGPDGQCALCRRESGPPATSGGKRLVWLSAFGLVLLTVALVLARSLSSASSPAFSVTRSPPRIVAEAPRTEAEAESTQPTADPEPAAAEPVADAAPAPDPSADSEAAPAVPGSAAEASPSPSASGAPPTEAALAAAIRATPIVMFSTGWCAVCARARAFLSANGLRYSERDIDRDKNARDELKRRTGEASIPTIEVDGELLTPGFSEQEIMNAVASSAKRRLGVKELEVRRTQ